MKKILFIIAFVFVAIVNAQNPDIHRRGVIIGSFASDPTGVSEGQIYWNSTTKIFRQYNGTTWSDLAGSGGTINIEDEGILTVTAATILDFVGSAVTVTDAGGGKATITIVGGSGESTTVSDTNDVDLTLTGSDITATTIIDVAAGNKLTKSASGLFVDNDLSTYDNTTSNFSTGAHTTNTDSQVLDVSQLTGTNLELSLSGDGEATKVIDLSSLQDGTGTDDQTASEVNTNTAGFNGNLSGTDTTVQSALDTLDDLVVGTGTIGGSITDNQVAVGSLASNEIEGYSTFTYSNAGRSLTIGSSDALNGVFNLTGYGTGAPDGGIINLFTAADYDTSIDRYVLKSYEDDFVIDKAFGDNIATYRGNDDVWNFNKGWLDLGVDATTSGFMRMYSGSGGATAILLYNPSTEQTDTAYWRLRSGAATFDGNFFIMNSSSQTALEIDAPTLGLTAPNMSTADITALGNSALITKEYGDANYSGGGGTVTSVAVLGTDGIEVDSGSPITTSGTIQLGLSAATLTSLGLADTALQSEVDGSVTNELQTIANTSDATTHTATLSNSGGSLQLIEGSGITLTTGGTGLNGTVTIASTGGGATNLGYTASPTNGIVTSDTGTDATLTLATGTNAGLLAPADFTKLSNTSGTNTGDQTITLTGDVTGSGTSSFATTITNDAVTYAKMQNSSVGFTVLGKTATGSGDFAEIVAGTDGVLRRSGTGNLSFGSLVTNNYGNNTVSLGKMSTVATQTFLGRNTAATGNVEALSTATAKTMLNLSGTNSGDQTSIVGITGTKAQFDTAVTDGNFLYVGDVTSNATHTGEVTGATALTIASSVVDSDNIVNGTIDELDLDVSVNASLDLADSSVQQTGTPISGYVTTFSSSGVVTGTSNLTYSLNAGRTDIGTGQDVLRLTSAAGSTYIDIDNGNGNVVVVGDDLTTTKFVDSNGTESLTGTALDLSDNITGKIYNEATPSTATAFTTSNLKAGGFAYTYINSASEPTVNGSSTETGGSVFQASTLMKLVAYSPDGATVEHFFVDLGTPSAGGGSSPLTTKGDLYTYSTVDARLGVGTNGQVLTADSAEATGLKWAKPEYSKTITVESPSASEDISIFFTNKAITVTEIRAITVGTSPSTTWTIKHETNRSSSGNPIITAGTTTTSQTSGNDLTSFNDATILADSFVWLETTATSGTVNDLSITIFYTID